MKSAEDIFYDLHKEPYYAKECPNTHSIIIQAMKDYAKQAIDEQLEIAAKEATVESETPIGKWHPEYSVDQDSILNCTRVVLA